MKNFFLTDREIKNLINESKNMNRSVHSLVMNMKIKQGRGASHSQNMIKFPRSNGEGEWLIYLRQNRENHLDFSCGLGFIPRGRKHAFTLVRYNGKSHQHTNHLEKQEEFYDFHIHQATERYQRSSYADEHYATSTSLYTDIHGAVNALLSDCKVMGDDSGNNQVRVFE